MVVQLSDFTAHHNPLILTTSHQFLSLMISPTLTIVESKRMLHALRLVGHMWFQDEYATVFAVYKEPAAAVEAARLELIRIKRALGSLVKLPADRLAAYRNVKDERHFLGLCGVIPAETASPLMTLMSNSVGGPQGYKYVDDVVKGILRTASHVSQVPVPLVVGWRAWYASEGTTWVRAMTLSLARGFVLKAQQRVPHDPVFSTLPAATAYSVGHLPGLTRRQARRSGVEQEDLRARWA